MPRLARVTPIAVVAGIVLGLLASLALRAAVLDPASERVPRAALGAIGLGVSLAAFAFAWIARAPAMRRRRPSPRTLDVVGGTPRHARGRGLLGPRRRRHPLSSVGALSLLPRRKVFRRAVLYANLLVRRRGRGRAGGARRDGGPAHARPRHGRGRVGRRRARGAGGMPPPLHPGAVEGVRRRRHVLPRAAGRHVGSHAAGPRLQPPADVGAGRWPARPPRTGERRDAGGARPDRPPAAGHHARTRRVGVRGPRPVRRDRRLGGARPGAGVVDGRRVPAERLARAARGVGLSRPPRMARRGRRRDRERGRCFGCSPRCCSRCRW
jgi:hypothetical protein